ncbi:ThiJ/PfpI, partial [Macrophomina phaseolina MS6]
HSLSNAPPLDILIIPGSAPIITARPAIDAFIQSAAAHGTTILCICTGIFPTAASGVLEGRAATGPLVMLSTLRAQHPEIQWNNTRRWEKSVGTAGSGDIWTSGSIANGVDLMCAFMRERFSESKELMDMMIKLATIPERESAYNEKESALETLFEETG